MLAGNKLGIILKRKRVKCLKANILTLFLYPDPGSNRDGLLHWCLRPARLPIPPSGLSVCKGTYIFLMSKEFGEKLAVSAFVSLFKAM